jgi:hypothetical protein
MSENTQVQRWVSRVTLALLALLTVASIVNLHDMAEATHTADGVTAWIVAVAIGGTLSVLVYVASITDGSTRTVATSFAIFAALVSTVLQVSLFLSRGANAGVALAFGVGVPFFEVALALTDSMLRRYVAPATVKQLAPVTVDAVTVQPTPQPAPKHAQVAPATDTVNKSELARKFQVSRPTINTWLESGKLRLTNDGWQLNGANGTGD